LYIGAERVKLVDQHKYLGIVVDPKLSFEQNAAYAVKKARRVIMGLKRKTARHWGQETQDSLRKIYYGAILPILSYASRVWIDRIHLSKIKRKYLSAYGTVARLLTQSYVSVSTEAAGVLAGILPLDLEIQLRNCASEIRHARGAEFQGEYIAREAFDSLSHAHQYLQIKAEDVWQDR
jgi:hypothetical protein